MLDDEDECGIVDGGGGVELNVDGPARAFVCSPFMATMRVLRTRVDSVHTIATD